MELLMATHLDRTGSFFGLSHEETDCDRKFSKYAALFCQLSFTEFFDWKFHRLLNLFLNRVSMITRFTVSSP